jgi:hypothetical protein
MTFRTQLTQPLILLQQGKFQAGILPLIPPTRLNWSTPCLTSLSQTNKILLRPGFSYCYFSLAGDVGGTQRYGRAVRDQNPQEGHHHSG